jgi:RNA polymerase-binding transcription factor DksA
LVTSHTLTPTLACTRHRQPGQQPAPAAATPNTAVDPSESLTGAQDSPDAVALVWDLTMHRLYQAFAEFLAASPDATQGGQTPAASMSPARTELADVQLAATRHAVNDIQDASRRMAAGSYGTCERCGQPITTERLQAAPTTRWCPAGQADRCG